VSLHYNASRFLLGGFVGALSGWEVLGRDRVPHTGGLIVAPNHCSYWDPLLVGTAVMRELHFLAKEELFRPPVFGPLIRSYNAIPIRRGATDKAGLARAIDVLRAGRALIVFPEGTRARDGELRTARPGVGMLAVSTGARILPVYVDHSHRPRDWMLRKVRLRVVIGHARTWQELAGVEGTPEPTRALYQAVGDGVMHEIATLKAS